MQVNLFVQIGPKSIDLIDIQALKEASRNLQIESIQELNQKIEALEKKHKETDVLITELKTNRKSLEMILKEKTDLSSYLLFLFRKTQNALNEGRDLLSALLTLASYAANSTSTTAYETTSAGDLAALTTCSCLPVSIQYKCDNVHHTEYHMGCSDQDQGCLNSHWPTCSKQTEEDIFEWSTWSQPEIKMLRRRKSGTGNIQQVEKQVRN